MKIDTISRIALIFKVSRCRYKGKMHMKRCLFEWIRNEIEIAESYGIQVNVEGIPYTMRQPEELLYVLEDVPYMKEYLGDERGKIIQINFNKVSVV